MDITSWLAPGAQGALITEAAARDIWTAAKETKFEDTKIVEKAISVLRKLNEAAGAGSGDRLGVFLGEPVDQGLTKTEQVGRIHLGDIAGLSANAVESGGLNSTRGIEPQVIAVGIGQRPEKLARTIESREEREGDGLGLNGGDDDARCLVSRKRVLIVLV